MNAVQKANYVVTTLIKFNEESVAQSGHCISGGFSERSFLQDEVEAVVELDMDSLVERARFNGDKRSATRFDKLRARYYEAEVKPLVLQAMSAYLKDIFKDNDD